MAWQNTKTNWQANEAPVPNDVNRWEGNLQYLKDEKIDHSLATAANDFLIGADSGGGVFKFFKKTLTEVKAIFGFGNSAYKNTGTGANDVATGNHDHATVYAPIAKGVTNGDSHDHNGGDGAQISHANLGGLTTGDPHTQYVRHALATAANDFLVASGAGAFVKKTVAEAKSILGITAASTSAAGVIEIATQAEVTAGTDTIRAVVPGYLKTELDKRQNNTKIYGSVTYTDSIAALSSLTKNIALGGNYKHGIVLVRPNAIPAWDYGDAGVLTFVGTYNLATKVSGGRPYASNAQYPSAWSRRKYGKVVSAYPGLGGQSLGDSHLELSELYIDGSNLRLDFYNTWTTEPANLSCFIDWEVW